MILIPMSDDFRGDDREGALGFGVSLEVIVPLIQKQTLNTGSNISSTDFWSIHRNALFHALGQFIWDLFHISFC
jgi:hypothetical protein